MIKQIFIFVLCLICVHAQDPKTGPVDSSTVLKAVWCITSESPWECARGQAGRVLIHWDNILDEKRNELLSEADEETKTMNAARAASNKKISEKPSDIMKVIEESFAEIRDSVSEGVENFVSRNTKATKVSPKQNDDDDDDDLSANDFNDMTLYEEFEKSGLSEGRVVDKINVNKKAGAPGALQGFGYNDYNDGYYGGNFKKGGYKGGKGKKGKKKKLHKKGIMKLFLIGAVIKAKIEMLLKILSFKLQLKFFVIALVGLVINIARFWIDIKNKGQKVVYIEHAQHQHHYDQEEDSHGWGSGSSGSAGGYWKRSGQSPDATPEQQSEYAQRLAYLKH